MSGTFLEKLADRRNGGHLVCAGLDPDIGKVQKAVGNHAWIQLDVGRFLTDVVDAVARKVAAFKPNAAFFAGLGLDGIATLKHLIAYIQMVAPWVVIILDFKRGDILKTNDHYVREAFETFAGADAITIHPYLGAEANGPFLEQTGRGVFVLCRTSNPGAGEFQDLMVAVGAGGPEEPLFCRVARNVAHEWKAKATLGVVVGATYPAQLGAVRQIVGEMPILIPGVGTQGGDLEASIRNSLGGHAIVNVASSMLYASSGRDHAEASAREIDTIDLTITDILSRISTEQRGEA